MQNKDGKKASLIQEREKLLARLKEIEEELAEMED